MPDLQPVMDQAADLIGDSMRNTISCMFGMDVAVARGAVRMGVHDDFLCMIDLRENDDAKAVLNFAFDKALIHELVRRMFAASDLTDENIYSSAACEIANVVCGNLKTFLNSNGFSVIMDVPRMVDGCDISGRSGKGEHFVFEPQNAEIKNTVGLSFNLRH